MIVSKAKFLSSMSDLARALCYSSILGLNGAQRLRATNKNVALIYSVTINEKTTNDCAP